VQSGREGRAPWFKASRGRATLLLSEICRAIWPDLKYLRKKDFNSSNWVNKTTQLKDCINDPSRCKLFKSRTMTQSTLRAAGSSAPQRGVLKSHICRGDGCRRLGRLSSGSFSASSLHRVRQKVIATADTFTIRCYNHRFSEDSLIGARRMHRRIGCSRIDTDTRWTDTRSNK
jgi:hypothetical protein